MLIDCMMVWLNALKGRVKVSGYLQVSVDTACSSALVGTHLGLQHLRQSMASVLSCGVNLMLAATTTAAAQAAGMLTLDGRCKTLDASADGYVRYGQPPLWQRDRPFQSLMWSCTALRLFCLNSKGACQDGIGPEGSLREPKS